MAKARDLYGAAAAPPGEHGVVSPEAARERDPFEPTCYCACRQRCRGGSTQCECDELLRMSMLKRMMMRLMEQPGVTVAVMQATHPRNCGEAQGLRTSLGGCVPGEVTLLLRRLGRTVMWGEPSVPTRGLSATELERATQEVTAVRFFV